MVDAATSIQKTSANGSKPVVPADKTGNTENLEAQFLDLFAQLFGGSGVAVGSSLANDVPNVEIAPVDDSRRNDNADANEDRNNREDEAKASQETDSNKTNVNLNAASAAVVVDNRQAVQKDSDTSKKDDGEDTNAAAVPQDTGANNQNLDQQNQAKTVETQQAAGAQVQHVQRNAGDEVAVEEVQNLVAKVTDKSAAAAQAPVTDTSTQQTVVENPDAIQATTSTSQNTNQSPKDMRGSMFRPISPSTAELALPQFADQQEIAPTPQATTTKPTATPVDPVQLLRAQSLAPAALGGSSELGALRSANGTEVAARGAVASFSLEATGERSETRATPGVQRLNQTMQARLIEKIQEIAENASMKGTTNSVVLRLDPPDLGQMTVKITKRADQLFARITPDSPEVEHTLRNRVHDITHSLANIGIRVENIHVSIGQEMPEVDTSQFTDVLGQGAQTGDNGGSAHKDSSNFGEHSVPPEIAEQAAALAAKIEAGWVA